MNAPVILNVDDNEPALYARSRVLRQAGFEVVEARSGEAALAQLAEAAPKLVLLDINLPDMPGYEVCKRIKASPIFSSVLVLHISATFAERRHRVLGLDQGADGYLSEPVEPAELIATVKAFLRLQAVEEALRESEEKYRTLMESLADGVFVLQDERFVFANAAFASMVAASPKDLIDVPAQRFVAAESLSRWAELCGTRMAAGREPGARHEIRMAGGNEGLPLWTEMRARVIRYAGRPALLGIVHDITERRLMEQMLRQRTEALVEQDRHKDEFLAMLAHELRNPLAPLVNALQIMRAGQVDDDARKLHDMMERQLRQLSRLVDDMLDVSRMARGQINLQLVPMDLSAAIAQATETSRPLIDARRHKLHMSLPYEPIPVQGDLARLTQVFLNLLNNAAKYTGEGGTISVRAACEDGFVSVRVSDTGRGIPAVLLPKVFELFTQAERTLDRAEGGLGIGLTLVRRLVHAHGGAVEAHSEGEGLGSEFVVRLPLASSHVSEAPAASVQRSRSEPQRVLVVDDNHDVSASYALLLRGMGHSAHVAGSGEEAIAQVRDFQPRLVLMDLAMPGMSGIEAARRLRLHYPSTQLTLVAVTGYTDPDIEQFARDAGFDRVLTKPLAMHTLGSVIASLMS